MNYRRQHEEVGPGCDLVVVHDTVHALNPQRVHRPIHDQPLELRRSCLAHALQVGGKQTRSPLLGDGVVASEKLIVADALWVQNNVFNLSRHVPLAAVDRVFKPRE